jgi:hypothetical protein
MNKSIVRKFKDFKFLQGELAKIGADITEVSAGSKNSEMDQPASQSGQLCGKTGCCGQCRGKNQSEPVSAESV